MTYQRRTVDVEELFTKILRTELAEKATIYDLQEMQVMSQADVNAIEHVPFVVVSAHNGHMFGGGPNTWEWDVFVQIVAFGRDEAADIADMVYVAMHESHDKNTQVPFVGAVTSVDDVRAPSKSTTSTLPAGDLIQYDGQFRAVVRKI